MTRLNLFTWKIWYGDINEKIQDEQKSNLFLKHWIFRCFFFNLFFSPICNLSYMCFQSQTKKKQIFSKEGSRLEIFTFLKCPKCPVKALSVLLTWKVVCTERTCLQNYSVFDVFSLLAVTHRQLIFHVLIGTWSLGFCLKMCTIGKFQAPIFWLLKMDQRKGLIAFFFFFFWLIANNYHCW